MLHELHLKLLLYRGGVITLKTDHSSVLEVYNLTTALLVAAVSISIRLKLSNLLNASKWKGPIFPRIQPYHFLFPKTLLVHPVILIL
jgi:hypothetical protein